MSVIWHNVYKIFTISQVYSLRKCHSLLVHPRKLSFGSRASKSHAICHGMVAHCFCFAFSELSFGLTDSLFFIETRSFVDETMYLATLISPMQLIPKSQDPDGIINFERERLLESVFVAFPLAS